MRSIDHWRRIAAGRTVGPAVLALALAFDLFATAPTASAQPPSTPPLIGFLAARLPLQGVDQSLAEAFRQGLRDSGLVENRDLVLDVVWTSSEAELSKAVNVLTQRRARLLIPVGTTASMAVKQQAPTTAILFISVGNPVGIGLVDSLSRPGANITGSATSSRSWAASTFSSRPRWESPRRWSTTSGMPDGGTGATGCR